MNLILAISLLAFVVLLGSLVLGLVSIVFPVLLFLLLIFLLVVVLKDIFYDSNLLDDDTKKSYVLKLYSYERISLLLHSYVFQIKEFDLYLKGFLLKDGSLVSEDFARKASAYDLHAVASNLNNLRRNYDLQLSKLSNKVLSDGYVKSESDFKEMDVIMSTVDSEISELVKSYGDLIKFNID